MKSELHPILMYAAKAREGIHRVQGGPVEIRLQEILDVISKGLEILEGEVSAGRLEIPTERVSQFREPVESMARIIEQGPSGSAPMRLRDLYDGLHESLSDLPGLPGGGNPLPPLPPKKAF